MSRWTVKIISAAVILFSVFFACELLYINAAAADMRETVFTHITLAVCAAFVFIISSDICARINMGGVILTSAAVLILAVGIITAPYAPSNDTLELHNILNAIIFNRYMPGYKAYMDFWINNKFTVLCYLPFARLTGSARYGSQLLNAMLITGFVFFTARCAANISRRKVFAPSMFSLALFAPYMLLSGPYIYLPSLFLSSAAAVCATERRVVFKIPFFVCSALLFVLRPTALGFILVFLVCRALFFADDKKLLLLRLMSVIAVIALGAAAKSGLGYIMYKTGAHRYPALDNAAALWTIETGTRPLGKNSGNLSYNPYNDSDDFDEIQHGFVRLFGLYYADERDDLQSLNEIKDLKNDLKSAILRRTADMTASEKLKNLFYKSVNFHSNLYAPYYYRANLKDENTNPARNNDKRFFAYMNAVSLLFFIAAIVTAVKAALKNRESDKCALAAAAGAIAVNIALILLTEVSRKYMFDFLAPMLICAAATFAGTKKIPLPVTAAAVSAVILRFGFYEASCRTEILKNAEFEFESVSESVETLTINFENPCPQGFKIKTYDHNIIDIAGEKRVELTLPKNCSDALTVIEPDGDAALFSTQKIE